MQKVLLMNDFLTIIVSSINEIEFHICKIQEKINIKGSSAIGGLKLLFQYSVNF